MANTTGKKFGGRKGKKIKNVRGKEDKRNSF
jgi:hypothetical protein